MIGAVLSALTAVVLLDGPRLNEGDKEKLRDLARVPPVTLNISLAEIGFELDDEMFGVNGAAELEQARTARSLWKNDLETAAWLGKLLGKWGTTNEAEKAVRATATMCRERLKRNPDDVRALLCLAECATTSGEESERLLRHAVTVDPADARAWNALGRVLFTTGITSLFGSKPAMSDLTSPVRFSRLASRKSFSRDDLTRALDRFDEVRRCLARVARIETRDVKLLWECGNYGCTNDMLLHLLHVLRGDPIEAGKTVIRVVNRDACLRAADLCPNDHRIVKSALASEIMFFMLRKGTGNSPFTWVGPDERISEWALRSVRTQLERLETVAGKADGPTALRCAVILAPIYAQLIPEPKKLEKWSRLAVDLGSTRDDVWACLLEALDETENVRDLVRFSLRNVRRKDTALARYQLAYAYDIVHDYKEAEHQLTTAMVRFPDDLQVSLGMAAMLLRPGRDDQRLKAAGVFLERVKPALEDEEFQDLLCDYFLLRGIQLALRGDLEGAETALKKALELEPRFDAADKALTLLGFPGKPLRPMPRIDEDE